MSTTLSRSRAFSSVTFTPVFTMVGQIHWSMSVDSTPPTPPFENTIRPWRQHGHTSDTNAFREVSDDSGGAASVNLRTVPSTSFRSFAQAVQGSSEFSAENTHYGSRAQIRIREQNTHFGPVRHSLIAYRAGKQLLGLSDHSVKGHARARHVATDVISQSLSTSSRATTPRMVYGWWRNPK